MNITKIIDNLPITVGQRVLMSLTSSMNARVFNFARLEYQALQRLGLSTVATQATDTDRANALQLVFEARRAELDMDDPATQARDNGMDPPRDWKKEAEPFVLLKEILVGYLADYCKTHRLRMNDPRLEGHIDFVRRMSFVPNIALAEGRVKAAKGRFTLEQAIGVQKKEFENDRKVTLENGEGILSLAESLYAMDLPEGAERNLDSVLEHMSPQLQLTFVNTLWRKLEGFFDTSATSRGFLSQRYRSTDVATDMSLTTMAIDDTLKMAQEILDRYDQEERTDGMPDLPIVDAIAKAKKEAQAASHPAKSLVQVLAAKTEEVGTTSTASAIADAIRRAAAAAAA